MALTAVMILVVLAIGSVCSACWLKRILPVLASSKIAAVALMAAGLPFGVRTGAGTGVGVGDNKTGVGDGVSAMVDWRLLTARTTDMAAMLIASTTRTIAKIRRPIDFFCSATLASESASRASRPAPAYPDRTRLTDPRPQAPLRQASRQASAAGQRGRPVWLAGHWPPCGRPPWQATRKGWPYYIRSSSDCTAWLPRTPCIVGPPLAGGLPGWPAALACRRVANDQPAGVACRRVANDQPAGVACRRVADDQPAGVACRRVADDQPAGVVGGVRITKGWASVCCSR